MTQFYLPGFQPSADPVSDAAPYRGPFAAQHALATYPDVPGNVRSHFGKPIGRAGEALVTSVLSRYGFETFQSSEEQRFDLLVRYTADGGQTTKEARIQVKTATAASNGCYSFGMQRGYRGSPQGRQAYDPEDYEVAALVILPRNAVYFTTEKRPQHVIRVTEVRQLVACPRHSLFAALGLPPVSIQTGDDDHAGPAPA